VNGLLRQFEVCKRLGISDETWMRWQRFKAAGREGYQHYPGHVAMPGVKRWKESDIEAQKDRLENSSPINQPGRYFGAHRRRSAA